MDNNAYLNKPLPLNRAARFLFVPVGWLREEIGAGRLPGLRAGRIILVHVPTVAKHLAQLAKSNGVGPGAAKGGH